MNEKRFELIERYSKEQMAKLGLYAWPHVQRVLHLCMVISKFEDAAVDLDIVKTAALLHDVAKHLEKKDSSLDHGEAGAVMAENFLKSVGFGAEKIRLICHAIRVHTHREEPNSIEAKILHDADFIDKLGAVGIATIFVKACLTNKTIEEVAEAFESGNQKQSYVAKHIRWLKKPHLYTKTAQRIARNRSEIVSKFFKELKKEIESNDSSS